MPLYPTTLPAGARRENQGVYSEMGAKVIIWLVGGSETPPLHQNSPECRGWSEIIPRPIPNLPLKSIAPQKTQKPLAFSVQMAYTMLSSCGHGVAVTLNPSKVSSRVRISLPAQAQRIQIGCVFDSPMSHTTSIQNTHSFAILNTECNKIGFNNVLVKDYTSENTGHGDDPCHRVVG